MFFFFLVDLLCSKSLAFTDIAHINLSLRSMDDFVEVNEIYKSHFGISPPTRACIATKLAQGCRVMLDAIARRSEDKVPNSRFALHVQSRSYWAPANIGPYSQAVSVSGIRKKTRGMHSRPLIPFVFTFRHIWLKITSTRWLFWRRKTGLIYQDRWKSVSRGSDRVDAFILISSLTSELQPGSCPLPATCQTHLSYFPIHEMDRVYTLLYHWSISSGASSRMLETDFYNVWREDSDTLHCGWRAPKRGAHRVASGRIWWSPSISYRSARAGRRWG